MRFALLTLPPFGKKHQSITPNPILQAIWELAEQEVVGSTVCGLPVPSSHSPEEKIECTQPYLAGHLGAH